MAQHFFLSYSYMLFRVSFHLANKFNKSFSLRVYFNDFDPIKTHPINYPVHWKLKANRALIVARLRVALRCFCSAVFFSVIIYGYECITVTKSFTVAFFFLFFQSFVCWMFMCAFFDCRWYKCYCCCSCYCSCSSLLSRVSLPIFVGNLWGRMTKKNGERRTRQKKTSCLLWIHKWLQSQIMLLRHYICGSPNVSDLLHVETIFVDHVGAFVVRFRSSIPMQTNLKTIIHFMALCSTGLVRFFSCLFLKLKCAKDLYVNQPIYLVMLVWEKREKKDEPKWKKLIHIKTYTEFVEETKKKREREEKNMGIRFSELNLKLLS